MWDFISLYYANMIRMVYMGYAGWLPDLQTAKDKYLTEFEENEVHADCYLCDAHPHNCEDCELAKNYKPCSHRDSPYQRLWDLISIFNASREKNSATADEIIRTIETIRDCCK